MSELQAPSQVSTLDELKPESKSTSDSEPAGE